jgi:ABC-type branched-subunit amino acid transport system substrate-binding protein
MRTIEGARQLAASLVVAALAGCSSTPTATTSQSSSSSAPAGATVIKIGIDLPVSGADASTGIPTRNGAVQAIEEADAQGRAGRFHVRRPTISTTRCKASTIRRRARRNVARSSPTRVLAMIGPFNSSVARPRFRSPTTRARADQPSATNPA